MKQETNPNDSIIPIVETITSPHGDNRMVCTEGGLTKREHFAIMAMQGLLANNSRNNYFERLSNDAVEAADALIKALNK